MLLSNSWLKYLIPSFVNFLSKLSNVKFRNWKLNLLLILNLIYFSSPFGMAFYLRLSLLSYCIIRYEFYFFKVVKYDRDLWFNSTLIHQPLCIGPLYFPVIWQWSLTLTSLFRSLTLSRIQHLVQFSKSLRSSLGITSSL